MIYKLKVLTSILVAQITNLIICICIYFLCYIVTLPASNFFKFDLKYGAEFSAISLLSSIIFCLATIYFLKLKFYKKLNRIDYYIIVFSLLIPIFITFIISLIDRSSIKYNYFSLEIFYLFISFLAFALLEEVVFRSVLLKDFKDNNYLNFAIFLSSIFFSLSHIGNNSFGVIPFLIIFLSGLILALIYINTSLFTVSIVHALWNSGSSIIIGGNVSGLKVRYSIFNYSYGNNNIINGGNFGIEGSMVTLIILSAIYLFMIYNKKLKYK
ncbi:MAG: CPBP family intramembrane metalloprotease [Chitinophagaceae bacterium]|jgi:membrane protease YdiL (CAAX protease family)|nr:CPBP family intramembrane metalloprotease [Chitinophagaceae bacterium]